MIPSDNDIYIEETELKPNRYAALVLFVCMVSVVGCWILNELGIFRVGKEEMRIGSLTTFLVVLLPLLMLWRCPRIRSNPRTKFFIVAASCVFSFAVGTLMTFHTTIMLLFPIFLAMLYRSRQLGRLALFSALTNTVLSPLLAYVIGSWDIALFKELILIGTGKAVSVETVPGPVTWINIGKILLYLVLPHLLMVGSCSVLMFYVIRVGVDNVNNQILLSQISHRDALTGLYNRNYFQDLRTRFPKDEKPLCVAFFDVNGLKKANDSVGHEYGDLLLQRSALSLLKLCDEKSVFGFRMGGDEFMLLVDAAGEEAMQQLMVRWQAELDKINAENETVHGGLVCDLAHGYACGTMAELEELVKLADERMYRQKAMMKTARED